MKFELDTHTHTIASGHAYNTIREMVMGAKEKGLKLIAITDHGPAMLGASSEFYFVNFGAIDTEMYGVEVLMGSEVNIIDFDGNVDLKEIILKRLDIVIASLHLPCISPGSREENTRAYINVMKNPYVNIIGHPDDSNYLVDYEPLVLAAKENKVLLELNNSSLNPNNYRINTKENDIEMLKLCKKYSVPIVVGSDAHFDSAVGNHDLAMEVLREVDFPEKLVVNKSLEELKKYVNKYKFSC
jgi:putative hydrolase